MLFSVKYSPNGKPEIFLDTLYHWLHSIYADMDDTAARRVLNLPEMEFDRDVPLSDALSRKPVITGEASAVTIRKTVGFTQ